MQWCASLRWWRSSSRRLPRRTCTSSTGCSTPPRSNRRKRSITRPAPTRPDDPPACVGQLSYAHVHACFLHSAAQPCAETAIAVRARRKFRCTRDRSCGVLTHTRAGRSVACCREWLAVLQSLKNYIYAALTDDELVDIACKAFVAPSLRTVPSFTTCVPRSLFTYRTPHAQTLMNHAGARHFGPLLLLLFITRCYNSCCCYQPLLLSGGGRVPVDCRRAGLRDLPHAPRHPQGACMRALARFPQSLATLKVQHAANQLNSESRSPVGNRCCRAATALVCVLSLLPGAVSERRRRHCACGCIVVTTQPVHCCVVPR